MRMNAPVIRMKLTLCLACALAPPAFGQKSPLLDPKLWADPPAESEPAFTTQQVAAWVAEMSPIVERGAGRAFSKAPAVKFVSRDQFAAAMARDISVQRKILGETDAAAIAKNLAAISVIRYVTADKTIYVPLRAVAPLLSMLEIEKDHHESTFKLLLLHELAHALQDQHVDIARLISKSQTPGHLWTVKQLLEGHAVLVQRLAAVQLRLSGAHGDAMRLMPPRATPERLAAAVGARRDVLRYHHLAHGGAELGMAKNFRGDTKRIWEMLRNPPEIVFRSPAESQGRADSAGNVLGGLDVRFGRSWEKVAFAAGGAELALKQVGLLDPDAKRQIAGSVRHVQTLICQASLSDKVPIIGNVTLFVLKDVAAAPALVAHLSEAQKRTVERGPLGDLGKIEPEAQRDIKLSRGRTAYVLKWSQSLSETAKLRQTLYWTIHGRYVVQVLGVNFDPPDAAVAKIFDEVLTRVDAMERAAEKKKGDG